MAEKQLKSPQGAAPAPVVTGAIRLKMLEKMRQNPRGDWTMEDVQTLCRKVGLECGSPTRGSHWKVFSKGLDGILTIPAKKPVKSVYIRMLVDLVDTHLKHLNKSTGEK